MRNQGKISLALVGELFIFDIHLVALGVVCHGRDIIVGERNIYGRVPARFFDFCNRDAVGKRGKSSSLPCAVFVGVFHADLRGLVVCVADIILDAVPLGVYSQLTAGMKAIHIVIARVVNDILAFNDALLDLFKLA